MFIAEIFESFHGEVNGHHQGRIVTFIRLSGCNLKCPYCDTKETWDPLYGENLSLFQILNKLKQLGHKHICLTGGEPLLYKIAVRDLLHLLWGMGYHISVETNGTIDITPFFRYVESFVIDYKMYIIPSHEQRVKSNYYNLRSSDVIKFVVKDKADAIQAFYIKRELELESISNLSDADGPIYAFSPIMPGLSAKELANLLIKEKVYNSVLSLQIHKIIGLK